MKNRNASLTVEAALVLPIFVFAALCILYINKMLLYEEQVQWALTRTGREASVEYAASGSEFTINQLYLMGKMNMYMPGKNIHVSLLNSQWIKETEEIDLVADYSVSIPFPIMSGRRFYFSLRYRTRAFTGVLTRMGEDDQNAVVLVYITKTGKVYHMSLECTYLKLSISQVKFSDIEYLRSEGGGKYYACEGCCEGRSMMGEENVFVCNYGDRFHIFRTCSKIKRSIQEIQLSQAGSRLPCAKCGT